MCIRDSGYGVDGWSGTATGSPSWLCAGQYNANYASALVGLGGSFTLSKHFDLRIEDYAFIPFSNTTVSYTHLCV